MYRTGSFDLVHTKDFDSESSKLPKLRGSVGTDLHQFAKDQAIRTDPEETRRRRTIRLIRNKGRSWGFTLQTYGIRNKRSHEVEIMSYVDYVELNGPAFVAGMRRGDVILSVNGDSVETCTHKEVVTRIQQSRQELRLVVLFEDCCRKVELHERYIKLKRLLSLKIKELRSLEEEERKISQGIPLSRADIFRQSLCSTSSSEWDIYSEVTSPSVLNSLPTNQFAFRKNLDQSFSDDVFWVGCNNSVGGSPTQAKSKLKECSLAVQLKEKNTNKEFWGSKGVTGDLEDRTLRGQQKEMGSHSGTSQHERFSDRDWEGRSISIKIDSEVKNVNLQESGLDEEKKTLGKESGIARKQHVFYFESDSEDSASLASADMGHGQTNSRFSSSTSDSCRRYGRDYSNSDGGSSSSCQSDVSSGDAKAVKSMNDTGVSYIFRGDMTHKADNQVTTDKVSDRQCQSDSSSDSCVGSSDCNMFRRNAECGAAVDKQKKEMNGNQAENRGTAENSWNEISPDSDPSWPAESCSSGSWENQKSLKSTDQQLPDHLLDSHTASSSSGDLSEVVCDHLKHLTADTDLLESGSESQPEVNDVALDLQLPAQTVTHRKLVHGVLVNDDNYSTWL